MYGRDRSHRRETNIIVFMPTDSIFRKIQDISDGGLGSCKVYYVKPGGSEPKHYHKGLEIVYVLRGSCKTHKLGQVYVYQKGETHEFINDSPDELVLVVLTVPPDSDENTVFI
jgi:quercetin dioxygenase-like cupin family protein